MLENVWYVLIALLCFIGLFSASLDIYRLPSRKAEKTIANLHNQQQTGTSSIELAMNAIATFLEKKVVRINPFKRAQLEVDLFTAEMDVTPERFYADAIVKGLLIGIAAIPFLFILPILGALLVIAAFIFAYSHISGLKKWIKIKRDRVDYELSRFVYYVEKSLIHSRDILQIMERYIPHAGMELKNELIITTADMKSGNYEAAITRMEARVGSPSMSDVCRGMIAILHGDDTRSYWAALEVKLSENQRQKLRIEAQKIPGKVNHLSMAILVTFMIVYVVVIAGQVIDSLSVIFASM